MVFYIICIALTCIITLTNFWHLIMQTYDVVQCSNWNKEKGYKVIKLKFYKSFFRSARKYLLRNKKWSCDIMNFKKFHASIENKTLIWQKPNIKLHTCICILYIWSYISFLTLLSWALCWSRRIATSDM